MSTPAPSPFSPTQPNPSERTQVQPGDGSSTPGLGALIEQGNQRMSRINGGDGDSSKMSRDGGGGRGGFLSNMDPMTRALIAQAAGGLSESLGGGMGGFANAQAERFQGMAGAGAEAELNAAGYTEETEGADFYELLEMLRRHQGGQLAPPAAGQAARAPRPQTRPSPVAAQPSAGPGAGGFNFG